MSSSNRLTIEGLTELRAALRDLPADLAAEAGPIVFAHAQAAYTEMEAVYRTHDHTGNLSGSLEVTGDDGYLRFGARAVVRNRAPHAWLFEHGSQVRRYRGASRGAMPPEPTFIPAAIRHRGNMVTALIALVRRAGLVVSSAAGADWDAMTAILTHSAAIGEALTARLATDPTLAGMLPDGVWNGIAPAKATRFALVAVNTHTDEYTQAGGVHEHVLYLVKAVTASSSAAPAEAAADRIHALLQDVPLTPTGYHPSTVIQRIGLLAPPPEIDETTDRRWYHRGGLYEIRITPLP